MEADHVFCFDIITCFYLRFFCKTNHTGHVFCTRCNTVRVGKSDGHKKGKRLGVNEDVRLTRKHCAFTTPKYSLSSITEVWTRINVITVLRIIIRLFTMYSDLKWYKKWIKYSFIYHSSHTSGRKCRLLRSLLENGWVVHRGLPRLTQ